MLHGVDELFVGIEVEFTYDPLPKCTFLIAVEQRCVIIPILPCVVILGVVLQETGRELQLGAGIATQCHKRLPVVPYYKCIGGYHPLICGIIGADVGKEKPTLIVFRILRGNRLAESQLLFYTFVEGFDELPSVLPAENKDLWRAL